MSPIAEPVPVELSAAQSRAAFDEAARLYLGVSGEEFIRAYDAGAYDADLCCPEVAQMAMLLPLVGRS